MILNMTDTNLWKNPYDGKEYEVGETIPVYDYGGGGLVYGSTVVKFEDPGFPGVVQTKGGELHAYSMTMLETEIQQWLLPAIEPESDWFFIGPEEIGWRAVYARKEILKAKANEQAQINALLNMDLDDDEEDN